MSYTDAVEFAVSKGVPREIAEKIRETCNALSERGMWIPVHVEEPRSVKVHHPDIIQGASVIRYWGPPELVMRARLDCELITSDRKVYHELTRAQTKKLYNKGELGKTHELVRGSAYFPSWVCPNCRTRSPYGNNPAEAVLCTNCKQKIPDELNLPANKRRPNLPPVASGARHRHWEIDQLYRRLVRNNKLESFLRLV